MDDCIFTGSSKELIALYKQKLNGCYALTNLGPIHWLLGIKVMCDRAQHIISLSQTSFINTILSYFSLHNVKPYGSPMTLGVIYSKKDLPFNSKKVAYMKHIPYYQAIGSLMYAAIATCPDITFAISILLQFLKHLGKTHWEAVKYIVCYLKGIKDL
jgi:hypothetical protein